MELEEEAKRNRQKYLDIIEESKRILEERRKGIIKGDWFYRKDGSKKKTTAKGFRILQEME